MFQVFSLLSLILSYESALTQKKIFSLLAGYFIYDQARGFQQLQVRSAFAFDSSAYSNTHQIQWIMGGVGVACTIIGVIFSAMRPFPGSLHYKVVSPL